MIEKLITLHREYWSTRMRAAWTMPIRLFLGIIWLIEGIVKINEGWLSTPKLASFLGIAADGVSGATVESSVVTKMVDLFRLNLGIFDFSLVSGSKLVDDVAVVQQNLAKLDLLHFGEFNLMPWIFQNILLANDSFAMFLQIMVVVIEILLGLMFIGGVFTFIASWISFGLMIMFLTSTGLFDDTWWMVFASIALMGGSGRAFGFDFHIMAYLKKMLDYFLKFGRIKLIIKGKNDMPV